MLLRQVVLTDVCEDEADFVRHWLCSRTRASLNTPLAKLPCWEVIVQSLLHSLAGLACIKNGVSTMRSILRWRIRAFQMQHFVFTHHDRGVRNAGVPGNLATQGETIRGGCRRARRGLLQIPQDT